MKTIMAIVVLETLGVAGPEPPSRTDLLPELQKGGYVLFIRHPKTNPDQADTDPLHLDNVSAQRQLSDEGRKQAKALGGALRALKVPVAKVIASKFNRAQEAAKLLDLGEVTGSLDVTEGGLVVSPRENDRRAKALRKLLSTLPPEGMNVVIVSHKPNLQDAGGKEFGDLAECETALFKPMGDGKLKLVARVPADAWTKWAK